MSRRADNQPVRFQLFSFLDVLTGLVGIQMFMLIMYSLQLREIKNPLAEILLGGAGSETDVAKTFFIEAKEGWAVMLPEGLCVRDTDLRIGGAFEYLIDKKIRMVEDITSARPGETAAVILIRGNEGAVVRNGIKRLLKTKSVDRGIEIIVEKQRTDRRFLLAEVESMGGKGKLMELDLNDPQLTTFAELYLLDQYNVPQPLYRE